MTIISTQPEAAGPTRHEQAGRLYRLIWRWHFYAGLFCIPFVILLSLTGAIYLFKTNIEAVLDAPYNRLVLEGPARPVSAQVDAAIAKIGGGVLTSYRLPQEGDDAAQMIVTQSGTDILAYVHPATLETLKTIRAEDRFMSIVRSIHGELLMGDRGSLIVELAASWAIVMVVTGLYLWWPRQSIGLAGVVWPRLRGGRKVFWRDLHAVTGVWVSCFAIILLLSGLPWTNVWGDAFTKIRNATGTASFTQDWSQSRAREHADSSADHVTSSAHNHANEAVYQATIDDIAASARAANLQPPVFIYPPSASKPAWRAVSQTQNRPLGATIMFDPNDGAIVSIQRFSDKHPIDQAVGIGIAAHEGHLFGIANQIMGLITAIGLTLLCISAFVMWRRRAPAGMLGAPPPVPGRQVGVGLGALVIGFGLFLPVLGISLICVGIIERVVLMGSARFRRWLGLSPQSGAREKGAG
jgi:uncharacterized iron-regulated membrane protein